MEIKEVLSNTSRTLKIRSESRRQVAEDEYLSPIDSPSGRYFSRPLHKTIQCNDADNYRAISQEHGRTNGCGNHAGGLLRGWNRHLIKPEAIRTVGRRERRAEEDCEPTAVRIGQYPSFVF